MESPTVVLFGDYDYSYPRERTFRDGLRQNGAEVKECRVNEEEKVLLGLRKLILLVPAMVRLTRRYRSIAQDVDPDTVVVTRNDHLLLPLAVLLCREPVYFDTFDSPVHYSRLNQRSILHQGVWFFIELTTLRLPDRLIGLTQPSANLRAETYYLPVERFKIVPIGADEDRFYPVNVDSTSEQFTVLYWGMFHPHHGVPTMLEAAKILSDYDDIHFVFVGDGAEKDAIVQRANEASLSNVTFRGRISDAELRAAVARADVCLGTASGDDMAQRSLMNRVCETLAMKRPLITARSPATERFEDEVHVLKVPPEDPLALAAAIERLYSDKELQNRLERQGALYFEEHLSKQAIGAQFLKVLPSG